MLKRYIGDSVYIQWYPESNQIVLTTDNGHASGPSNTIYLETKVMDEMTKWLLDLKRELEEKEANK